MRATPEEIAIYKVEPYVVAADVYALPRTPAAVDGRGISGSAGWMYRLIVESLLGLRLEVDQLRFMPCLPADWAQFTMHYRYRETSYHIVVTKRTAGGAGTIVTVDGLIRSDAVVPLVDDRNQHAVEVSVLIGHGESSSSGTSRATDGSTGPLEPTPEVLR